MLSMVTDYRFDFEIIVAFLGVVCLIAMSLHN